MNRGDRSSWISALKNNKGVQIFSHAVGKVKQLNSQKLSPSVGRYSDSVFHMNCDCSGFDSVDFWKRTGITKDMTPYWIWWCMYLAEGNFAFPHVLTLTEKMKVYQTNGVARTSVWTTCNHWHRIHVNLNSVIDFKCPEAMCFTYRVNKCILGRSQ